MALIKPGTRLKAASTSVVGSSVRVVAGTGVLAAAVAQIVGSGSLGNFGSGVLLAGAVSVVGAGGRAPVFVSIPNPVFFEGVNDDYDFKNDIDDDFLPGVTFSLSNEAGLGPGLSFDPVNGILNYAGGAISASIHTVTAQDAVGSDVSASFSVVVEAVPAPSPLVWEWGVPSLADETAFYINVMGWSIPSGAATSWSTVRNWDDPPTWNNTDPHNDNEGDDLWTWWHQLQRHGGAQVVTGSSTVQDWYDHVLAWMKANYLGALDLNDDGSNAGFGFDHLSAQGLATVYNSTSDATALSVLNSFKSRIEGVSEYQAVDGGGTMTIGQWEARAPSRYAIAAAYAAEATSDAGWIAIRDNMVTAFTTNSDWEEGGVIKNGGGMTFASRSQAGFVDTPNGQANYDAGYRFHSTFQIGLMAEAMWRMYVQTGSAILRDRLIKMARYVEYYGHDSAWAYPNVGSRFGHGPSGERWWTRTAPADGTLQTPDTGCEYDAALVNLCVIGYKLTGDDNLLTKAQTYFSRCNRWGEFNGTTLLADSINHVYRYIDTQCNPNSKYFYWNKGVLQYAYQILENGGAPDPVTYDGTIEGLASGLASGSWLDITSSMDNTNFRNITFFAGYTGSGRSALEYSSDIFWNDDSKELHFRGGGASDNNAQTHIRFRDSAGTWDTVVPYHGNAVHQWGSFSGNPKTGDLYFGGSRTGGDLLKWSYDDYPATATSWPIIAGSPWGGLTTAQGSLVWFPDLNDGAGGLLFVRPISSSWNIYKSDSDGLNWAGSWATTVSGAGIEGNCHYLPGQQLVMFGGGQGGSTSIWTVDSTGSVVARTAAPAEWGAGQSGQNGTIVAHTNGRVFLLTANGSSADTFHEWGGTSDDTWSAVSAGIPWTGDAYWMATTMIAEHDCIYCAIQKGSGGGDSIEHWIYKL